MRESISKPALEQMLNSRVQASGVCEGTKVTVYTTVELDEIGCNWGVGFEGVAPVTDYARFVDRLVRELREKYNVE